MTARLPVRAVGIVPLWRRIVGVLLVAYGAAGIVIVGGGALLVANAVPRLDGIAQTLDTQRGVLVRSLDATATFLADAQTGTANVDTSLASTVDSLRQVTTVTRAMGVAMGGLASASTISILGSQPFGGLSGTFSDVAAQTDAMATKLDSTADALATNRADLARMHGDIGTIRTEIDSLRQELADAAIGGADLDAATHALETTRLVLLGLLVWLALQGVIAVVAGVVIATRRSVIVTTGAAPPGVPIDEVV